MQLLKGQQVFWETPSYRVASLPRMSCNLDLFGFKNVSRKVVLYAATLFKGVLSFAAKIAKNHPKTKT